MNRRLISMVISTWLLVGCGDDAPPDAMVMMDTSPDITLDAVLDTIPDAVPDAVPDADLGPLCSGPPGLYQENSCLILAEGVRFYQPKYTLWSDDTDKSRYVFFPPDSKIDTSNPDGWRFPVGTRLWKTFGRNGKKLETRLFTKQVEGAGIAAWEITTYKWNESETGVDKVDGGLDDVNGTTHDIPSRDECLRCHSLGTPDVLIGISAIELNHDLEGLTLQDLMAEELLTDPIELADAVIPGTETDKTALGYMHVNCGPCHGGFAAAGGLDLWIDVGSATVQDTSTWMTAVNQPSTWTPSNAAMVNRIEPGDKSTSSVFLRASERGDTNQMPPLGSEIVDPTGLDVIGQWIDSLPTE